MKVTISVKLLNSEFDADIARDFFDGQETDGNVKYLWEDEMALSGDLCGFKIINNTSFNLKGMYPNGTPFDFEIPSVTLLKGELKNNQSNSLVISRKLVKKINKQDLDNGDVWVEVVLKDLHPFVNPIDGFYILEEDFPSELL